MNHPFDVENLTFLFPFDVTEDVVPTGTTNAMDTYARNIYLKFETHSSRTVPMENRKNQVSNLYSAFCFMNSIYASTPLIGQLDCEQKIA